MQPSFYFRVVIWKYILRGRRNLSTYLSPQNRLYLNIWETSFIIVLLVNYSYENHYMALSITVSYPNLIVAGQY